MAQTLRKIGLSLGADVCWPICFEELFKKLDFKAQIGQDEVRCSVDRVTIEPFDLRQECRYDLVIDRLTHWYQPSREWIKKAILVNDLYVFNNPWSLQSMEKQTSYCAMMRLGFPVPDTWLIPPKEYAPSPDLQPTLERYAQLFDLSSVGEKLGYPLFMKPYDGGGWVGVTKIDSAEDLEAAYEESGRSVMHLQKGVVPYDCFVRCIGLGPQVKIVRYDPGAPLHERYEIASQFVTDEETRLLQETTLTINTFFGWDFNSCEAIRKDGVFHPFDFANACPDSQVTSLHYHFPWLIKANLRWALFCATSRRRMRKNLDWGPFFDIADEDRPFREKLSAYACLARERLEMDRFQEFCDEHLSNLDETAWEFFGSEMVKDAIRQKVTALFPTHEVDEFTEMFWQKIQRWRDAEGATAETLEMNRFGES